ncbi:MAG: 4Fe-4S binding protein [Planctomycetota bacterium]|jgi:NAD-dependent dihydropyrimidine dehydrogenase PreA subunit
MKTDVYETLAQALDRLPGGFPPTKSRVELQILRKIFSPDEAQLANYLTGTSEAIDVIAAKASLPMEEIEEKLNAMRRKGIIWGAEKDGVRKFRLAPFIVGVYESQWEVMDHEFSHLVEQYWNEGGMEGIMRYEPALHRVVPAQRAVKRETVLPYDDVKRLILQAKSFELRDCICRRQLDLIGGRRCEFPLRACLNFSAKERPAGSCDITQDEALHLLDEAEEIGLVHTVSNVAAGVHYVCNCCGCCCAILRGITQFGIENSVARANYYAVVQADECNGCGICEERCQVGACSVDGGVLTIDLAKCIGCGLCVTGCPSGAVRLELKPDAEIIAPPDDYKAWELERLHNRGLL